MFSRQPNSIILIFTIIAVAAAPEASGSVSCQTELLPYPFGFSPESPIRFNCSKAGSAKIGEFLVQNVTNTSIYVGIPPECNRSIHNIKHLFGKNYAPSWKNIILLQDCEKQSNSCEISRTFVEKGLTVSRCGSETDEYVSCFTRDGKQTSDVMNDRAFVNRSRCSWFSTIAFGSGDGDTRASFVFGQVSLGWWLNGACSDVSCSKNADCTGVKLPNGLSGHRCSCLKGYQGDGFAAGGGCRKASKCRVMCGGNKKVGVVVAGILLGALLMVVLIVISYRLQKRSASSRSLSSTKRLLSEVAGNSSVPFYTFKEIAKATDGFSDANKLGTGAYGTVYAGKLRNESWFAIKRLRRRDSIDQVVNEIKLLSSVSHPNLVRLLGCCIGEGDEPLLVYEFMPNGTLSQHLQLKRGNGLPLPWRLRLTIAAQMANAIAHLHSSVNPPIYHRDIKSSNILLDYDFNSKLSDFGLSRLGMTEFDLSHISTAPQGTPGYLDPQYHQDFQLSDRSDVYSFGVVLVEIISALKVIDFTRSHTEENLAELAVDRIGRGRVEEIIDPYLEPKNDPRTFNSIHNVAELAFRCLSFHRDMRPTMMEVAEELERIRVSFWVSKNENDVRIERTSSQETSPVSVQEPWLSQPSSTQDDMSSG